MKAAYLGWFPTIVNPAGLPKWTQTMCVWCESRSRMSRSLTWLPGHKLTRNPNYCDIWTNKNSYLRRCSTRQPTVYSYTASHRSRCIRVDSPTQFDLHQHHDHYHPESHQKYPHCKLYACNK